MTDKRCGLCDHWSTNDYIQTVNGEGTGRCALKNEITFCDKHNCIAFYNAEQAFHNSRTTFAIIDDTLMIGHVGLSHADWLIGKLKIDNETFDKVIRGYYDDTGIYFYQGEFKTSPEVEEAALKYADIIDMKAVVYCGCVIGKVGERWKPIKQLR